MSKEIEKENLIPFTDDFMFSLVMRDIEICREFLELVIPEEEFGEIKIVSPENPLFGESQSENEANRKADKSDMFSNVITSETQKR